MGGNLLRERFVGAASSLSDSSSYSRTRLGDLRERSVGAASSLSDSSPRSCTHLAGVPSEGVWDLARDLLVVLRVLSPLSKWPPSWVLIVLRAGYPRE